MSELKTLMVSKSYDGRWSILYGRTWIADTWSEYTAQTLMHQMINIDWDKISLEASMAERRKEIERLEEQLKRDKERFNADSNKT